MIDGVHLVNGQQGAALIVKRILNDMLIDGLLVHLARLWFLNDSWPDPCFQHVVSIQRRVAHLRYYFDELWIAVLAYLIALKRLTTTVHVQCIESLVTAEEVLHAAIVAFRSIGRRVRLSNASRPMVKGQARVRLVKGHYLVDLSLRWLKRPKTFLESTLLLDISTKSNTF